MSKSPWSIPLEDTELKTSVGDQSVTSDRDLSPRQRASRDKVGLSELKGIQKMKLRYVILTKDEEGEVHVLQKAEMVSSEESQKGFENETESKGRGKEPHTV